MSTSERTLSRSPVIDAWAFRADGGSCLATTRKMYDAASAGLSFANTGPERWPKDSTAIRPRSASACVRGSHPVLVIVAPVTALVVDVVELEDVGRTRAYQYQRPASAMMRMRQPTLRKQPFIVVVVEVCFSRNRTILSLYYCTLVAGTASSVGASAALAIPSPQPRGLDAVRHLCPLRGG